MIRFLRDLPLLVLLPLNILVLFLFLLDISFFVDASKSHTFVAKEHVVVDKLVIVSPLPRYYGPGTSSSA